MQRGVEEEALRVVVGVKASLSFHFDLTKEPRFFFSFIVQLSPCVCMFVSWKTISTIASCWLFTSQFNVCAVYVRVRFGCCWAPGLLASVAPFFLKILNTHLLFVPEKKESPLEALISDETTRSFPP